jgi:hypothetical protein
MIPRDIYSGKPGYNINGYLFQPYQVTDAKTGKLVWRARIRNPDGKIGYIDLPGYDPAKHIGPNGEVNENYLINLWQQGSGLSGIMQEIASTIPHQEPFTAKRKYSMIAKDSSISSYKKLRKEGSYLQNLIKT